MAVGKESEGAENLASAVGAVAVVGEANAGPAAAVAVAAGRREVSNLAPLRELPQLKVTSVNLEKRFNSLS